MSTKVIDYMLELCEKDVTYDYIPEIEIKLKIDKKVYLLNQKSIIKTIKENLSYEEKMNLLNQLVIIKERNSNISNYLKVILIGVIIRKESVSENYKHAL
ncbi:hypothetical protein IMZ08_20965 [Bacillus luteolus]|uniref:Uncharacterized protein n=1 Tax=Litchfieldia luteola TaxID=682179 RepID=A0ABR9QPW0_9BACI|nr:hypothetical protein [Cytobacillus luteolus]MBE4910512.1 hypothetical protein [Cytobacillus luteolus]MBP1943689.1 hypothetical protein [Cytobacillus luteolus]